MDDWVAVDDASSILHVGSRQVRNLIQSGALPARRYGNSWLVQGSAVRSRAMHAPSAGRPLSPALAWVMLAAAQHLLAAVGEAEAAADIWSEIEDRQVRHRLRRLLAEPVSERRWKSWLAARAERRRVWVHPGVVDRMAADPRLHPGGSIAAAASAGISAGPPRRFYIQSDALDSVMAQYRASDDPVGPIELMVLPSDVAQDWMHKAGPVPEAVALADMLDSDDARERYAAAEKLSRLSLGGSK
jgi:hypothetical protein